MNLFGLSFVLFAPSNAPKHGENHELFQSNMSDA